MRRLLALALALTVSACGDAAPRAPFAESRTPPSLGPKHYPPAGWAWGYVRSGDGLIQRYGVASPPVAPRGAILILPGYGETAEKWFETASDFQEQGFTVWVLERQGQGGSERATPWRDLGHAESFAPDVAAVRAMVRGVIRPAPDRPLLLLGHADGGLVALRAAQEGLPMTGLVLSAPAFGLNDLPRSRAEFARFTPALRALRLGWVRAPGQSGWSRESQSPSAAALTHDPTRAKVQAAWMLANPDLRMGGASLGWYAAFFDASDAAGRDAGRTALPVLMLGGRQDGVVTQAPQARVCRAMHACRLVRFDRAAHDLHMESDPVREAWLREISGFIAGLSAPRAPRVGA